jgi:hypothetical protein
LGTPEATGAAFTDTATPHRAMVLMTTVNCGATCVKNNRFNGFFLTERLKTTGYCWSTPKY